MVLHFKDSQAYAKHRSNRRNFESDKFDNKASGTRGVCKLTQIPFRLNYQLPRCRKTQLAAILFHFYPPGSFAYLFAWMQNET